MKTAIITGSTGLIGSSLVSSLVQRGVNVCCLSSSRNPASNIYDLSRDNKVRYFQIPMEEIVHLPDLLNNDDDPFDYKGAVFFHLAWRGNTKLTDGTLEQQLINVSHTSHAIQAANKLGCSKFINIGSIEENIVELWLKNTDQHPLPSQLNYGLAKLASRDMARITSYLEKIDYVHTRFSVPLDFTLNKGGYIASTLKKILTGRPFDKPLSPHLYDIISLGDAANALFLVGENGKNKSDYYIGLSKPTTLAYLFDQIACNTSNYPDNEKNPKYSSQYNFFSTNQLVSDTGFEPVNQITDLLSLGGF